MTAAIPVTTRRFGPSGSRKNANIILEHTTAVIARISKELFLKLTCMRVSPRLRMIRSYRGRVLSHERQFDDGACALGHSHSALMFAALMTGHHFSISDL